MHCHTTWGQWAVELLQCSPSLPGGSGQCNSCNAECLRGTAAPCGPGPPAWGMGSPAQAAVGAHRVPVGDGSPLRPGPTSLGDGEVCPSGSRCPQGACGGRQPPAARAHQLGGWGLLCCIVLRCVVLYCVVLCCVALRCVVLRCAALRCAALRCAVLCCAVLCCVVLCCVVLCCAVLCCVVLCCVVLCCVVLCCVVLCYVVLCCVVLCWSWYWLGGVYSGRCFPREYGSHLMYGGMTDCIDQSCPHEDYAHQLPAPLPRFGSFQWPRGGVPTPFLWVPASLTSCYR